MEQTLNASLGLAFDVGPNEYHRGQGETTMSREPEPRNPLYVMLLIVGLFFVVTVLAYALIPVLEEKAKDAGQMPPPSPFREALRHDGWKWVLAEVALLVVLGLASMGVDRWRRLRKEGESSRPTAAETVDPPPTGPI